MARHFRSSPDGWIMGEPDLVLTIPVAYEVADGVSDVYTGEMMMGFVLLASGSDVSGD